MSLTLVLIRHAKSDWDNPLLDDHDRPLNDRGRHAAPRIGAWLRDTGINPEQVICSTARRTQETWSGIASQLPDPVTASYSNAIYHADPATILTKIQQADTSPLAIIGHNPGIGSIAYALCAKPPTHPKFGFYPTGASLILRFDVENWAQIEPGMGEVIAFTVPRDLKPEPS
ncbi:histidine phosphatase family protein [Roseobacter sp. HKCCD9010]|uniref:SixA phosphatase family protein n=1 Tax=unclassified Roseobacter TaxID=196798 RepID=UPI001490EB84|nr:MULTISPECIES: histidine phosphatase family protein [unclassified Roseobacter]MBF9051661.1 histidine phosphatase family protein [Rhodobacterales bacterium HKCCD4356]NNV13185.1 histidine phosphatase family protein [Roseobacter sp. HKCCD7357]NNV17436.1 histidine phosphatase family protein [Roseobacter sp. HKCCD8768]NNV27042.1 histidine phosphatase family protein [Roseobacter sp. HKCCD8192]NNV31162.1 histidine phosphatase family protein [Roseobacter sp. HKCCD9061]